MLERTSRFVLEVVPYLLSALIAAVVVPGFLYSQARGTKAAAIPNVPAGVENALEMIHWDHVAFGVGPGRQTGARQVGISLSEEFRYAVTN
jgi:hypothetical protein